MTDEQLRCYQILALHAYRRGRRFLVSRAIFW